MNCSRDSTGKLCRRCKYVRKHFKNFVIKTLLTANIISLLFWLSFIDYIISWQPYLIMAVNFVVICWIALVNDVIYY